MKRILLLLAAMMVGCASDAIRPPQATPNHGASDRALAALKHWRADGRIAIQKDDQGWSARLRWIKAAEAFQLRLIAPLGRGSYELAGTDGAIELAVPNGQRYYAASAEALMNEHLGWSIPLGGAQFWLRGMAAPHSVARAVQRDASGSITDFEQDGWRVSVLGRRQVEDFALPTKLFLHYEDLKVRIVLSEWLLGESKLPVGGKELEYTQRQISP